MAWQEKYERKEGDDAHPNLKAGEEKIVYCDTDKHRHEAPLISKIEAALGAHYHGKWKVRVNSYKVVTKCPTGAITLKELGIK
jgi:hypothetical protein